MMVEAAAEKQKLVEDIESQFDDADDEVVLVDDYCGLDEYRQNHNQADQRRHLGVEGICRSKQEMSMRAIEDMILQVAAEEETKQ